jgi:UDP-GlcNAc3NAcA epimerase
VIFPVHPRTAKLIERHRERLPVCIQPIDAVSYFDLLQLLHHADFVLTDSGGLQKETYWAEKPCITLRGETEWVETVKSGWNQLYREYTGWPTPASHPDFYGDGHASERIVQLCKQMFNTINKEEK